MSKNNNKNFKRIAKLKGNKSTTYILPKIKSKTNYYFKVEAYTENKTKMLHSNSSNILKKKVSYVNEDLLAIVSLTSYSSTANRNNNLRVASKLINGTVLKSGERFVWSRVVGAATKAKGYKEATVFVNKKHAQGVGGGICQVSTTVYQTAKKCHLKIIERHQHSLPVSYTTKGKDATVSHGVQNLIFKNNKSYAIKIVMKAKGGTTTCKMYKY